jgi:hypothetical protein
MEYTILLDSQSNVRDVEVEEQTRFVISIIEALEVPFEWDSNVAFTVFDKVRLRKVLGQYNVSVIDNMDGGVKIYLEREQIAEWIKPSYILKEDPSQIDPKKKLYIEMKCVFNSIYEKNEATE